MTLKRTGFNNRGKPLRPASEKRLAEAGGFMLSTFRPKTPAGGVISGGRSSRPRVGGHRIERDSAAIVTVRSGKICEIQLKGCWRRAVEKSHRIARGAGGCFGEAKKISDRPSDLMDSCTWCHLQITRHPWKYRAKFHGWVLKRSQDPTATKVLYRGVWALLGDNGEIVSSP